MEKEGIITDYTKLNEEILKETELWKKLKRDIRREKKEVTKKLTEKPWDRIQKRKLKNILRIHEKGLDNHIKNQIYYYQIVHGETYEMHLADLDRAQKLETQRLKWIVENPRNKDYQ